MIHLYFHTVAVPLKDRSGRLTVIRLKGQVSFKNMDGSWSRLYPAIIDTGAHTSVLPEKIWRRVEKDVFSEQEIKGVNPKPECSIPALLARITCMLHDDRGNHSKSLLIPTFLAESNEVPLILGFAGLLATFEVMFNYLIQSAYLSPAA